MSGTNVIPFPSGSAGTPGGPAQVARVSFQRGDEVELAHQLLTDLRAEGELTVDEGGLWQYDRARGVWGLLSHDQLETCVASYAGCPVVSPKPKLLNLSRGAVVGARKLAQTIVSTDPTQHRFEQAVQGVAFANGFVVVSGGLSLLDPHAPGNMVRHGFTFPFDRNALHPQLDRFFADVFGDAPLWDAAERVAILQEFAGLCLIGEATRFQKALVVVGDGDNGKSALLEIIEAIFPPEAVCALAPQDWAARFRTAGLVGKLANIVNEISENEIVANAIFKSVISGEPVTGEKKNQTPFTFRPVAGHIFAANSLPATVDFTMGFWRRFMVIPLTRNMRLTRTHRPKVAEAIIAAELPGIVAWALEGAERVQRHGRFTHSQASQAMLFQWRREVDAVVLFLQSECTPTTNSLTSSQDLYRAYSGWAHANGFSKMSSTKFLKRVNMNGHSAVHTRTRNCYQLLLSNAALQFART